jgi:uncharacterized membrane protein
LGVATSELISQGDHVMGMLILGLVLFLACHSVRVFAEDWRTATMLRLGDKMYKGLYSLVSLLGFVLLVYGYSLARVDSSILWLPPVGTRHAASLLMLVATYVPRNAIQKRLRHPMVLSVKVWALAHLISNGRLVDVVLFGTFLVWAVLSFRAARQRDRLLDSMEPAATEASETASSTTMKVMVIGALVWAVFLLGGHAWLFGVSPIGMGVTGP